MAKDGSNSTYHTFKLQLRHTCLACVSKKGGTNFTYHHLWVAMSVLARRNTYLSSKKNDKPAVVKIVLRFRQGLNRPENSPHWRLRAQQAA
jgi:hypothetical protein